MIQAKRSNTSDSLFREAQYAVIVLDTEEKEEFFKQQKQKVVKNRRDPRVFFSGAKTLKTQFLAALSQLGEVKTANIWARKLLIDLSAIKQLQAIIEDTLREKKIYGVTEIHLQDPEINSSHIQFVGIRANEAEIEIAKILVSLGYEQDISSAIGGSYIASDITHAPLATTPLTPQDSSPTEEYKETEAEIKPIVRLRNLKEQLTKEVQDRFSESVQRIYQQLKPKKNLRKLDNEALKKYYKK